MTVYYRRFPQNFDADNYAVLRTRAGRAGAVAYVYGRTTARDGGEGTFIWDATITAGDDDDGTVLAYSGGSGGWRRVGNVYKPEQFGAVGDGVTQDSDAFVAMSAAINAAGGGVVELNRGATYLVGKQSFAGSYGLGYAYTTAKPLYFLDCSSVTIHGNGATLTAPNGLKFGNYDPATGLSNSPALPFTDVNYRANATNFLWAENVAVLQVEDLTLDGNCENHTLGGEWGDEDYQCEGIGIYLLNFGRTRLKNVRAVYNGLDGLLIAKPGLTEADIGPSGDKMVQVQNCDFTYNGRNNVSVVGGIGIAFDNCNMSHAGQNGLIASSPGNGVDLEAESSIIRQVSFRNCQMVDNHGAQFLTVADVADCELDGCIIWTTATSGAYASWIDAPRFDVRNTYFYGPCVYASPSGVYDGCVFDDKDHPSLGAYPIPGSDYAFNFTGAVDTVFRSCEFRARNSRLINVDANDADKRTKFEDCTFTHSYDGRPDQDSVAVFGDSELIGCLFQGDYASPPANAYVIDIGGGNVVIGPGNRIKPSTYLRANSWTSAFGVEGSWPETHYATGANDRDKLVTASRRGVCLVGHPTAYGSSGTASRELVRIADSIYPGGAGTSWSGTFKVGDTCENVSPTSSGVHEWRCTTAGTPGTWTASVWMNLIRTATATPITVSVTEGTVISNLAVAGAVAVTLPTAEAGYTVTIKDGKGDAAVNNITVTPPATHTIDGAATLIIAMNYGSATVRYCGGGIWILV